MSRVTLLKLRKFFVVTAVLMMVFVSGYYWGQSNTVSINWDEGPQLNVDKFISSKKDVDFTLFLEVWDRIKAQYIDKGSLKEDDMIFGAIKGMVASAGDPYTVFLTPDENKRAKDDLSGLFEGVGIQLGFKDWQGVQRLAVIAPLEGMPAIKAGVKAGDLIAKIDDEETGEMTLPEAVEKIRGEKGSFVRLALLSEGDTDLHDVEIVRDVIHVPSVELVWITDQPKHVAHLKVNRFGELTINEWNEKVREMATYDKAPVKGLVLDLRSNPGGFFQGAIDLGSDLVSSGVIVQQESADGNKEQFRANGSARLVQLPLVVLINEGSASAAEILAGALRDLRSVKLVGVKSFGKGSVQEAFDLAYESGLHVTTYRWLLPSGVNIDKDGIKPDVEIKDDPTSADVDEQLIKAIEVL